MGLCLKQVHEHADVEVAVELATLVSRKRVFLVLDEELVPENFGTINAITALIEKKRTTPDGS